MSLRTKIALAFLMTAAIPVIMVAVLAYRGARDSLLKQVAVGLDAIVRISEEGIRDAVVSQFTLFARLIDSHQLALSTAGYLESRAAEDQATVERALREAMAVDPAIISIRILGTEGALVAEVGATEAEAVVSARTGPVTGNSITGFVRDIDGSPAIAFAGPIVLEGRTIGRMEAVIDARRIVEMAANRNGLGRTGEILVVIPDADGSALALTPLRFDADASLRLHIERERADTAIIKALNGVDGVYTEGVKDYRGKEVIAAMTVVRGLGWGIVAKVDREEALAPLVANANETILNGSFMLLMVFFIAFFLTQSLTGPILELSKAAARLGGGDFSVRAMPRSNDEVGRLAAVFNDAAKRLQELHRGLEAKIRERTKQLQVLLEQLPVGILLAKAPKGEIEMVNPKGAEILGRGVVPGAVKDGYSDVYDILKEDGSRYAAKDLPVSLALTTGRPSIKDDIFIRRPDGMTANVKALAEPIVGEDGTMTSVVAVFEDRTKEFELDRRKDEFLSFATHQLKTPPTAIKWNAEMLLKGEMGRLNARQKETIEDLRSIGDNMIETVGMFLNISRAELGTFSVEPVDADLAEIVDSVLKELRAASERKKLKVVLEGGAGLPKLKLDPALARTILQNVISNAVKYTLDGGTVRIALKPRSGGAVVEVEDSGIGIPKDQQPRVFERMFRAQNARQVEGTGFGLYLVKLICEKTGLRIGFESEEGVGTTFRLEIPKEGMRAHDGSTKLS